MTYLFRKESAIIRGLVFSALVFFRQFSDGAG